METIHDENSDSDSENDDAIVDETNRGDETIRSDEAIRSDDVSATALNEASEMLSQHLGEAPLVPRRLPLHRRAAASVARHHGLLVALCVALLWSAMTLRWPGANAGLELGATAIHDVIAPRATTLLDREATQERREQAAALVTPEYDSDLAAQSKALANLNAALRVAKEHAAQWQRAKTTAQNPNAPSSTRLSPTARAALSAATSSDAISPIPTSASATSSVATSADATTQTLTPADATSAVSIVASSRDSSSQNVERAARLAAIARLNRELKTLGFNPLASAAAQNVLEITPVRWNSVETAARQGVRAAYFSGGCVQQIRSDVDDDLVLAARRIAAQIAVFAVAPTSGATNRNTANSDATASAIENDSANSSLSGATKLGPQNANSTKDGANSSATNAANSDAPTNANSANFGTSDSASPNESGATKAAPNAPAPNATAMNVTEWAENEKRTAPSSTRLSRLSPSEENAVLALATNAARVPNLVVDARKTERSRTQARANVSAVYRNIVAGSVLLEAGSVVDREHWAQLQDLDLVAPRFDAATGWARLLLCVIAVGFAAVYLSRASPEILRSSSALWLLVLTPPILVSLARVLLRVPFGESLLMPMIAVGAMMLTILLNARPGLLCGLSVSLLCAVMARLDSMAFASILLGASVGVLAVSEISTRAHLMRAIFMLGIVSAILAVVAGVLRETPLSELASSAIFAGGCGAVAVALAAGLAMFWERPLGITTHLSLLELSSPDEPVMRRMQSEAPGTYTHSLMVAQLSEAGAKAVGADALLCRVGGLYHDVGKLRRPHCFIENQGGVNVHDRLTPQLSALLIIAHVKDGLELARALRLPRPIHDIIGQHHGTDLVSYFFHRAQQAANIGLGAISGTPDEATFRYSGPRPQSKEAAIVMLADAVEASSRALADLTPEKLQEHIKNMIAQRLQAGELAECELTMRDLSTVERAFAHVLRGALHQRIEYPDPSRDWKNASEKSAPNWTAQAMRDPQRVSSSENARPRPPRANRSTSEKISAAPNPIAPQTTANEPRVVKNTVASAAKTDETPTPERNRGLASFASHFRRARSSPNANIFTDSHAADSHNTENDSRTEKTQSSTRYANAPGANDLSTNASRANDLSANELNANGCAEIEKTVPHIDSSNTRIADFAAHGNVANGKVLDQKKAAANAQRAQSSEDSHQDASR